MKLSNSAYDFIKKALTVYVPAIVACFTALCSIWEWNLPVEQIVATVSALETLCGVLIGISTRNYWGEQK